MSPSRRRNLPRLDVADAAFVTERLLVGGDLDTRDEELAARQLRELVEAGVTHVLDTRIEWSDEEWVAERAPDVTYLHHGMDDAGQQVPFEWFDEAVAWAQEAIDGDGVVLDPLPHGRQPRARPSGSPCCWRRGGTPSRPSTRSARRARSPGSPTPTRRCAGTTTAAVPRASSPSTSKRVDRWRQDNQLDVEQVIRRQAPGGLVRGGA